MKKIILSGIAFGLVLGAFVSGCTDSAPSGPTPSLGSATVTKYVAIGNSLTAGYQSNGLYESAQLYSFPNLIAQQLTKAGASLGSFEQPYWPDPGIPDPNNGPNKGKAQRYVIISFANPTSPVVGQKGETPTASQPKNATTVTRPYDNLGIPGIPLAGFMDTTGTYQSPPLGRDAILRWTSNAALGKSVYRQVGTLKALGQTADLVTFWLGANDVLGFATTGGTSGYVSGVGALPTPTPATGLFDLLYGQALDGLKSTLPSAKVFVGTIPDVKAIPFFTTVNASVAPILATYGAQLCYQKYTDVDSGTGRTTLNPASSNYPLITLKAAAYAPYLTKPTGLWYRDVATLKGITVAQLLALMPKIDTTKQFGLDPRNPFPNALILDSTEQALTTNAILAYNTIIKSVAAAKGAYVVDFYSIFNNIKANGYATPGETYTADYISGGLFSLDGVHPTSRGYGVVANEFIKAINANLPGASIPYVDISTLPGIPYGLGKFAGGGKYLPSIPLGAWESFDRLWDARF